MTLFDPEEGDRRKREGMEQSFENAPGWTDLCLEAVHVCALKLWEFTTDAVHAELGTPDEVDGERRGMGEVMKKAAKRGWIEWTDRTEKSKRPVCHRGDKRVWRSLICEAV